MEEVARIRTAQGVTARYYVTVSLSPISHQLDILWLLSIYFPVYGLMSLNPLIPFFPLFILTEKGQKIQIVPTFQKRVKGK